MSNLDKRRTLLLYTILYRMFVGLLVAGLLAFLIGLIAGMSGWKSGYAISILGFLLTLLILPLYLIYRTRFNKTRLAVHLRERYRGIHK
jgi:uncharacterized oligopeptide transporter (OPT) family protein